MPPPPPPPRPALRHPGGAILCQLAYFWEGHSASERRHTLSSTRFRGNLALWSTWSCAPHLMDRPMPDLHAKGVGLLDRGNLSLQHRMVLIVLR